MLAAFDLVGFLNSPASQLVALAVTAVVVVATIGFAQRNREGAECCSFETGEPTRRARSATTIGPGNFPGNFPSDDPRHALQHAADAECCADPVPLPPSDAGLGVLGLEPRCCQ